MAKKKPDKVKKPYKKKKVEKQPDKPIEKSYPSPALISDKPIIWKTRFEELSLIILKRMEKGESLLKICEDKGMPSKSTFMRWLSSSQTLADQYGRAREAGIEVMAEEIKDIADTPVMGVKEKHFPDGTIEKTYYDMTEHRKLQVDARKWLLSKMLPKKYGDRMVLAGDVENPLAHIVVKPTDDQVKKAVRELDAEY